MNKEQVKDTIEKGADKAKRPRAAAINSRTRRIRGPRRRPI